MKHEVNIHRGYVEWEEAKEEGHNSLPLMFGKYQHIFSSEKGRISMVKLKNYLREGDDFWEIFCLDGDLFEDVERFNTKVEAMKMIEKLL